MESLNQDSGIKEPNNYNVEMILTQIEDNEGTNSLFKRIN